LADELITNAAVHAQTDLRLRLELGGELLHVAVRDLDRRLPRPLPDDPQGEGGRGLRLVEQMATTWGAQPHPGGGKVVWCTLRTQPVAPSRRLAAGPSFPILEPKLAPPFRRQGLVARPQLLDRLTAASSVPVVALVAPPGYGKTTLLAHWVEQDPRPVVWLSVDQHDNDPAVLLTYLAVALDRVEPIDPRVFGALVAPGTSLLATVVPRLGAALASAAHPLVVVIDDLQLLHTQECLDALVMLADHLGEGSQLVLAGRGEPRLPVPRLRAEGQVVELGPEALAMDRHEADALLQGVEVDLPEAEVAQLVRRTEGWPVAVYLAALSLKATGTKPGTAAALVGDDRFLVDYVQSVLVADLSPGTVQFLTRTAVLDRLSGPLCDATLATTGSGVSTMACPRPPSTTPSRPATPSRSPACSYGWPFLCTTAAGWPPCNAGSTGSRITSCSNATRPSRSWALGSRRWSAARPPLSAGPMRPNGAPSRRPGRCQTARPRSRGGWRCCGR